MIHPCHTSFRTPHVFGLFIYSNDGITLLLLLHWCFQSNINLSHTLATLPTQGQWDETSIKMLHLLDLCCTSSKADRVTVQVLLLNTQPFYDLFDYHIVLLWEAVLSRKMTALVVCTKSLKQPTCMFMISSNAGSSLTFLKRSKK